MSDEPILLDTDIATPRGKKPSIQYRTSPYTVEQYCALPYAQRVAVDAACNERAGLTYTTHHDETSEKPYTVGVATKKVKSAQPAQLSSTTSQPSSPMTTATTYVHPAPSPALHYLNTPELIDHDEAHPDNAHTSAVPVAAQEPDAELRPAPAIASTEVSPERLAVGEAIRNTILYDLATIVSRYVTLTPAEGDTDWTHWGPSPLVGGDTHSFAVNTDAGTYKCFTSARSGRVVDFVMFMEELSEPEAVEWLEANYPSQPSAPPELGDATAGPACAYPGYPKPTVFEALTAQVADTAAPAAPEAPVAIEGTVYSTTDYSLFHLLPENREVDQKHVRKLVEMISQSNLLHLKPLDVTASLGVIDGQHRLAAARELGVPVYYKIGQQLSETDITTLNVAQKNWEGVDYLRYWTVKGKPAYIVLTEFRKRHPSLSFSNAKMMLTGNTNNRLEEFRQGRWVANEFDKAEQVAALVERIATEARFKAAMHTGFVAAVYHCVANIEGFDANTFMERIMKQPRSLQTCASHKQYLTMFQEIYNYRARAENILRFF
jgi:hypothetical protein